MRRESAIIDKVRKVSPKNTSRYEFLNDNPNWIPVFQNQQLWDLGLPNEDMENQEKIDAKIQELDAQFDFVILAEFFDEGLVILARLMCWDLEDVSQGNKICFN